MYINKKLWLLGALFVFLTGCDVHRFDDSYDRNIRNMKETLDNSIKEKPQEETEALLDSSMDVLEEESPKIDLDAAEDALRCNLTVNREDPSNFFSMLSQTYEVGVVVDKDIKAPITLTLSNASIKEVLQALKESYGFDFERTSYGYRIFKPKMETKIFIINYLDIKRSGESTTSINSTGLSGGGSSGGSSGGGSSGRSNSNVTTSMDNQFWDNLESTLTLLVGGSPQQTAGSAGTDYGNAAYGATDYGATDYTNTEYAQGSEDGEVSSSGPKDAATAIVNRNTGVIVVRAFPAQLAKVQEYLYRTQLIVKRQVILETKILDIELEDQYATGIEWKHIGGNILKSSSTFAANTPANHAKTDAGLLANTMTIAMQKGKNFDAVIQLLSTQGKVSVLSSPRISVMNNQKAVIKVGTDEFYATDAGTTSTMNGNNTIENANFALQPFFSGISMDVTPQISAEDEISLHIHPVVSRVESETRSFKSNDKETSIPMAKTTVREADTIVSAQSEQVVIIGGLMENQVNIQRASVPVDDKLGILDTLFGKTAGKKHNRELVILVKPIVVKSDTWNNELKKTMSSGFGG